MLECVRFIIRIWRNFMLAKLSMIVRLIIAFSLFFFGQNVFAIEHKPYQTTVQPVSNIQSQSIPQAELKPAAAVVRTAGFIPAPPDFDAKAYILIDANSGHVLAEKNADQRLAPASLTKLMTLYLIAQALNTGQAHLSDMVNVSQEAWRAGFGGSRMFIKHGTSVSLQDLISGIATASGNDATVAIAEYLAGYEQGFVNLMNQTAKKIGMANTNFTDSNGLPNNSHYSTARDLSILSKAWIANFPEYYPWFKERWMSYNGIKQPNRNRLLWRDSSVDGLKTGHTNEAGYCLAASAVRNGGMRLISVILGAKSDEARSKYSEALLNYGFRFFETRKLFAANIKLVAPRVWLGKEKTASLGLKNDFYITLPVGQYSGLKAKAAVGSNLKAPIVNGLVYGALNVTLDGKTISSQPLVALQNNQRANFIFAIYDYVLMLFQR
jgi:D-alanyl-D-alanine carboxypeptidase (penicillin-binding protein 5/6)